MTDENSDSKILTDLSQWFEAASNQHTQSPQSGTRSLTAPVGEAALICNIKPDVYAHQKRAGTSNQSQIKAFQPISWQIQVDPESWQTIELEFSCDLHSILKTLCQNLSHKYPRICGIEQQTISEKAHWLVVEFESADDEEQLAQTFYREALPASNGVTGFLVNFQTQKGLFSISISNLFFLGQVPHDFFITLRSILANCVGFPCVSEASTLHECCFDPAQGLIADLPNITAEVATALKGCYLQDRSREAEIRICDGKVHFVTNEDCSYDFATPLSIEVMEDRELEATGYDDSFLLDNPESAFQKLKEMDTTGTNFPLFGRRYAILGMLFRANFTDTFIENALESSPNSLLYLSLGAGCLDSNHRAIECLGLIGNQMESELGDLDRIKAVETTFPEVLGDRWLQVDPITALQCFRRLRDANSQTPRHFSKIAYVANMLHDFQEEIAALNRLTTLVNHKILLGKINFYLAQTFATTSKDQSLEHANAALRHDRTNLTYALYIAEILLEHNGALQAIKALDVTIEKNNLKGQKDHKQLQIANLRVAEIWYRSLNRKDIAVRRLENVLYGPNADPELIDQGLDLLDLMGFKSEVKSAVARLIERAISSQDQNLATVILTKSESLLHDDHEELSQLYYKFSQRFQLNLEQCDELLQRDIKLDWQQVYKRNELKYTDSTDIVAQQKYHQIQALIASKYLDQEEAAAKHLYLLAQNQNAGFELYQQAFDLLVKVEKSKLAINLATERLTNALPEDLPLILRDLLSLRQHLDVSTELAYAFELNRIDPADSGPTVQQAIIRATSVGDEAILRNFWDKVINDSNDHQYTPQLIRIFLNALKATPNADLLALCDEIYKYLISATPADSDIAAEALSFFAAKDAAHYYTFYVAKLLDQGRIPDLPFGTLETLLADDKLRLATLYEVAAATTSDPQEATCHLKALLNLNLELGHGPDTLAAIYLKLGELWPLAPNELTFMISWSQEQQSWTDISRLLAQQWSLVSEPEQRHVVAALVVENRDNLEPDSTLLKACYSTLLANDDYPDSLCIDFSLLLLETDYQQEDADIPNLIKCIEDIGIWRYRRKVNRLLTNLAERNFVSIGVRDALKASLVSFAAIDAPTAQDAESFLHKHKVSDETLKLYILGELIRQGNTDIARQNWWRSICYCQDVNDVAGLWSRLQKIFTDINAFDRLVEIINLDLESGIPEAQTEPLLEELLLLYALNRVDQHQDNVAANKLLLQRFAENPADDRVWLPILDYYRETGDTDGLCNHIQSLLPRLKRHPEVLANVALNIESLENELTNLLNADFDDQLESGDDDEATDQSSNAADPLSASYSNTDDFLVIKMKDSNSSSETSEASSQPFERQPISSSAAALAINWDLSPLRRAATTATEFRSEESLPYKLGQPHLAAPPAEDQAVVSEIIHDTNTESLASEHPTEDAPLNSVAVMPPIEPLDLDQDNEVAQASIDLDSDHQMAPTEPDLRQLQTYTHDSGRGLLLIRQRTVADFTASLPAAVKAGLAVFNGYSIAPPAHGLSAETICSIESRDEKQFALSDNSALFAKGFDDIVGDWRETVRSLDFSPGMTKQVVDTAFESALEKHLAVQCFSIISGDTSPLSKWSMKVWRDPGGEFYPFEIGQRIGKQHKHPAMMGHLYKLLTLLVPVMLKQHDRHFSIDHVAHQAKIDKHSVIDKRIPILWDDEFFAKLGIARFKKRLYEDELVCFSLEGLGAKIYYDYRYRALYFDGNYYRNLPPSHAFHRLMVIVRAVKSGFYPILKLNPERHLLPLVSDTKIITESSFKSGLKFGLQSILSSGQKSLEHYVRDLDHARLASLYSRVGDISLARIKKIQSVLWDHLYKSQLAETLDLIGISEAILGKDLEEDHYEPLALPNQSRYIRELLILATALHID